MFFVILKHVLSERIYLYVCVYIYINVCVCVSTLNCVYIFWC